MSLKNLTDVLSAALPIIFRARLNDGQAHARSVFLYWQAVKPVYLESQTLIPEYEYNLIMSLFKEAGDAELLQLSQLLDVSMEIIALRRERTIGRHPLPSDDLFSQVLERVLQIAIAKLNEYNSGDDNLSVRNETALIHGLIEINDLLLQVSPSGHTHWLEKIHSIAAKLPAQNFSSIIPADATSPTTQSIYQSLNKEISLVTTQVQIEDGYLIPSGEDPWEIKHFGAPKFIKIKYPKTITEALTAYYVGNVDHTLPNDYVVKALQYILSTAEQKQAIVHEFFIALQAIYHRNPSAQISILSAMSDYFYNFNMFPPRVLHQIINEVDFNLEKTSAFTRESDETLYAGFQTLLALYKQGLSAPIDEEFVLKRRGSFLIHQVGIIADICATEIQSSSFANAPDDLPLFLKISFSKYPKEIKQEFQTFLEYLEKVNLNAPKDQKQPFLIFLLQHQFALETIVMIMGSAGINYLKEQAAETLLSLERTLNLIEVGKSLSEHLCIELKRNFDTIPQNQRKSKLDKFYQCIVLLSLLSNSTAIEVQCMLKNFKISNEKEITVLFQELVGMITPSLLAQEGESFSEQDALTIFSRLSSKELTQLFSATKKMSDNEYRAVYLKLLKRDLLGTEQDVLNFLHDTTQDDPMGVAIATHNQRIRCALEEHHISIEDALHYKPTFDVMLFNEGGEEVTKFERDSAWLTLWTYLQKLESFIPAEGDLRALCPNPERQMRPWNGLKRNYKNLHDHVEGAKHNIVDVLRKDPSKSLIAKIIKNIEQLELERLTVGTLKSFTEFAQHVKEQNLVIQQLEQVSERPQLRDVTTKNRFFRIEQWGKEKAKTFFLGDAVGCCLATTGTFFEAMVQRRLDDAMLFHVAVDKATNNPVALIWLYLAKTAENKIVLMANFFEVNTKYALNASTRLALLDALLAFTHQYCLANPGIHGFYMNQLSYGWNHRDLAAYPVVPLSLADKLGGPFIPGIADQEQSSFELSQEDSLILTNKKYYLASLDQNDFHQFDPAVLEISNKQRYIKIGDFIQEIVLDLVTRAAITDLEHLFDRVISKYQVILAPFYDGQLEKNTVLQEQIKTAAETAIALLASKGKTASMARFVLSSDCKSLFFGKKPAESSNANPSEACKVQDKSMKKPQ